MARDYLAIPCEYMIFLHLCEVLNPKSHSLNCREHVFSHGWLILPHVCGRLAVESTHASICIGLWSAKGLVCDGDIKASLGADEIQEEGELPMDWDTIHTS